MRIVPATGLLDYLIHKTADQSVNNSAVLVDDVELLFPMVANTAYAVKLGILTRDDTDATASIKTGLSLPVGATAQLLGLYLNSGGNAAMFAAMPVIYAEQPATWLSLCGDFVIQNGANAGNFVFQFAQNVAKVQNTTVKANSYLKWRKIG